MRAVRTSHPHVATGRVRIAALLAVLSWPAAAPATQIVVTSTDDAIQNDGNCTLQEALRAADWNEQIDACPAGAAGRDTIVVPAGRYRLTSNQELHESVSLIGAGADRTIIDTDGRKSLFGAS